jgi:tRNA-specific 2-thiouridylase
VRHRAPTVSATIVRLDGSEIELALDEPVAAITPGQSLVLYDGERVLGGGVIESGKKNLPVLAA